MIKIYWLSLFLFSSVLSFAQKEKESVLDCSEKLSEARLFFEDDKLRKAKKIVRELSSQSIGNQPTCQSFLYLLQGEIHLSDGDYSSARLFLNDALLLFQKMNNDTAMIRTRYQLALTFIEEDEQEKAIPYLDEIIDESDSFEQTSLLYEILDIRAMLYSSKGQHQEAMQLLKKAAAFAQKKKDYEIQTQLLNQVSTNYQSLGAIDSAIFYFKKLLLAKKETKDEAGLLSDYSTLGGLYRELGNYEEAQEAFIESIRYGELLNDTLSLLATYIDIANIYLDQRLLEPALDYTQKARKLAQSKGALLNEGQSLQLRATIFEISGQADQALLNYQSAFVIYERLGLKQEMADIQLKIASLFGSKDNLVKAENTLRAALQIRLDTGDKTGQLNTKLALCAVLLKLDKKTLEIGEWLKDCKAIAIAASNNNGLQETLRLEAIYYESQGRYKFALQNYRSYNQLRDSILNQENARIVRELEKRYETEKKDKEIALQKTEIQQQKEDLKLRNTQLVQLLAGILALFILVFLTIITYQRNRQFSRQQLSVAEKEKESQVLRALVNGEEQERRRIARDLHDGLGSLFENARLRMDALSKELPEVEELENYQKARTLINEATTNIREISHNMMPRLLSKYGLEFALTDLFDTIEKSNTIAIHFEPNNLDALMDELVEVNVYRITQELVKNILQHAAATTATIQLEVKDKQLNLYVQDNGKGFDITQDKIQNGIGIGSIRSRVLFLKGKLDIDSQTNKGTNIHITIPLAGNSKQQLFQKN